MIVFRGLVQQLTALQFEVVHMLGLRSAVTFGPLCIVCCVIPLVFKGLVQQLTVLQFGGEHALRACHC